MRQLESLSLLLVAMVECAAAQTYTVVSLKATVEAATAGGRVVLAANITPSASTGIVTFREGATILGARPVVGGKAMLPLSFSPGEHRVRAEFAGGTADARGSSPLVRVIVSPSRNFGVTQANGSRIHGAVATPAAGPSQDYLLSTVVGGVPEPTAASALGYPLSHVSGVATGRNGNVYVSSGWDCVFRVDPAGAIVRVAGNCRTGYAGDGDRAVNAQLQRPEGLAVDDMGNIFIADSVNCRIRQVDGAGIITTVAGTGVCGFSGDQGPATQATLFQPSYVALDSQGALYISDTGNARIRKVVNGTITTVAGNGSLGFSGDGQPATAASLFRPQGLAVSTDGTIYFADYQNLRIRSVAPDGVIQTIAGNGEVTNSGDGGPALAAGIGLPQAVALRSDGALYFSTGNVVRAILPNGLIVRIAGNGSLGGGPVIEGLPALDSPSASFGGIAFDAAGSLHVIDGGQLVRKVAPDQTLHTIAGLNTFPVSHYFGDSGPAGLAGLNWARGVATDGSGNLYIADAESRRVRKVNAAGIISTIAGNGVLNDTGDGGAAIYAEIDPISIAADASGNIYVGGAGRIRKIGADGIILTIAGTGVYGYSGDNGPATSALLGSIYGLAVDANGNILLADMSANVIRKIAPGGIITTIAGNGTEGFSGDGGPATSAQLDRPAGVTSDSSGNVYFADSGNYRVRKITPGGTISTIAGNGVNGQSVDGQSAILSPLPDPEAVAADNVGNVFIGSSWGLVDRVSPSGVLNRIAGHGESTYSGDGGPARNGEFRAGTGLALTSTGVILVNDLLGDTIRALTPQYLQPSLIVSQTHSGDFAWGQVGAIYTITVKNAEFAAPTTGAISVLEKLAPGLTMSYLSGEGWVCDLNICTHGGVLAAGQSLPPIHAVVIVDQNAAPQLTSSATVSGGGSLFASAIDTAFVSLPEPALQITATHTGDFFPGQVNAKYTVAVSNAQFAPGTRGEVTVTETLPAGLSLVSITGMGWNCNLNICKRSDALGGGGLYPPLTVTVNVTANQPMQVSNLVSVAGGSAAGATASDGTRIVSPAPLLTVSKTHAVTPMQGSSGMQYSLLVKNGPLSQPTSGTVTVTDLLPSEFSLTGMEGSGWDCASAPSCKRSNPLASGSNYPAITVTVRVAGDSQSSVVNTATVSGGGSADATASDPTTVLPFSCDINTDGGANVVDLQLAINEALGLVSAIHDLNHDGSVTVADVQKLMSGALGQGCVY